MDSEKTVDIVDALERSMLLTGGHRIIYSDNAAYSISTEMVKFAKLHGIEWRFTAPRSPWELGTSEVLHALALRIIRRLLRHRPAPTSDRGKEALVRYMTLLLNTRVLMLPKDGVQ